MPPGQRRSRRSIERRRRLLVATAWVMVVAIMLLALGSVVAFNLR